MGKLYKKGGEINPDDKSVKNYFAHGSGKAGGVLVGKRHSEGGIKAVNKSTGQPLEMEGGEVVITRNAVSDNTKREFNGEMLTNREILSRINESGGGVSFASGGTLPKRIRTSGKEYKYGGKMMKDHDIVSSCGCKHSMAKGGLSKTPAPKKDRITGSKKNKPGSAASKNSAKSITLSDEIVKVLKNKVEKYKKDHPSSNLSVNTLKAVMRRGMGAYSSSHRPTISGGAPNSRTAWGFARVNAFLKKKSGAKVKAAYVQDDDLMAKGGKTSNNANNLIEIKPNKYLYHKSNPSFRDKISKQGLIPKGKSSTWMSDTDIKGKVIFATNSDKEKDWFDSTYDDDVYKIDTTNIKNKWYLDPNYNFTKKKVQVITFEPIEKSAIELIYKGTGESYKSGGRIVWHDSDAPDANGKFKELNIKELAAWLIKTRKKDVKKISASINQQIVFNRKKDPKYASKMEKVRTEVYKQLGRKDLLSNGGITKHGLHLIIKNINKENMYGGTYKKIFDVIDADVEFYNPFGTEYEELKGNDLHIFVTPRPDAHVIEKISKIKNVEITDVEYTDGQYADGGNLDQEITCVNCGWHWNTKDSDESDKYICHKCGFDNRTFYDPEFVGEFNKALIYKSIKPIREANQIIETINYLESQNKMSHGDVTKFYKEYLDWYTNGVSDKMTIMISIPNAFSKMSSEDNHVFLDVFEKTDESVNAKEKLKELLELADNNGIDIYLEPIPRHNKIKDQAKKEKITRQYLISYYKMFGFELLPNGFMLRKHNQMKTGGELRNSPDFLKGKKEELEEHRDTFEKLRKNKLTADQAAELVVLEHLKKKPDYYKKYSTGGKIQIEDKKIIPYKEFLDLDQRVKSPYDNENNYYYPLYCSKNKMIMFFKDGNRRNNYITPQLAYKSFLFHRYKLDFKDLSAKEKNALMLGKQSLLENN